MQELLDFIATTGLANLDWRNGIMIVVGLVFIYLAIRNEWEPYELLPIGLGIVAANLPLTGLITLPSPSAGFQEAGIFGVLFHYGLSFWNILPPIIFLGIGALTDFGPVIANPKTLILGAAAQVGIFIAFWGAPLKLPNHATVACYATLEMQQRSVELRKMLLEQNRPLLYTRMGLNSGPVVVGNMGSAERMDYTMMGDVVNLAARLEGANKFYKTFSMISGSTYELTKEDVDSRQLDIIRVVGKKEPVPVHELLARKNETSSEMSGVVEQYLKGLKLYQDRNFADAVKEFEKVLTIDPEDGPSLTYVKRCGMFIETPPEKDWDGVFTFTEKG